MIEKGKEVFWLSVGTGQKWPYQEQNITNTLSSSSMENKEILDK